MGDPSQSYADEVRLFLLRQMPLAHFLKERLVEKVKISRNSP